jgi:hypothetical protein
MTTQEKFWSWFLQHEEELFGFDPEQEADREIIFDQLARELQRVDPDLSFELGPKETKRQFVISASGIKRAFHAVASLLDVAPCLERWNLIAFRPRRTPLGVVKFGRKSVDPAGVQFTLVDNGNKAGLYLFIPGFEENDPELKTIGYLLLDSARGEYDVESRLGLIKMFSPDASTEGDRYPLTDLPAQFDTLISQLEGRARRLS